MLRFSERFRVDGAELDAGSLLRIYRRVKSADARCQRPASFFELGTAMALLAFADAEVDDAVLEVGLGGRLDATNVVPRALSVITAVGMDHQAYLGDTLEAIAGEKAGIIQRGVPVVMAPQAPGAQRVIRARAAELGAQLHSVEFAAADEEGRASHHWPLRLAAAIAAQGASVLGADEAAISQMRHSAGWHPPARYQWVEGDPPSLLDASHNPQALDALCDSLLTDHRLEGRPIHAVFNVLSDRPLAELISTLALRLGERLASLGVPTLATPRGADPTLAPEDLAYTAPNVEAALARARTLALRDQGIVLVAGSFQLLADAVHQLTGEPRDPPVRG